MGTTKQNPWDMVGAYPVCRDCGSAQISRAASAQWNIGNRDWQLKTILDRFSCDKCGDQGAPEWRLDAAFRQARIRRLNDLLRQGQAERASIVITAGVQAAGDKFVQDVVAAVSAFGDFTADNDPHGEHDFGAFDLDGENLFFKIDYYDPDMAHHTEDAANPAVTHRVLTIMLASEY